MDEELLETVSACTLNRVFGYEPRKARRILSELGSAAALFALDRDGLTGLLGPFSKYAPLLTDDAQEQSERELERLRRAGCSFIHTATPGFPRPLAECDDCPTGLYLRTATPLGELFPEGRMVSMVGTRDMSPYGQYCCTESVKALASAPIRPTVVSGLAYGIDITAHRTALGLDLPTIAVLPTGIDDVYPGRHAATAAEIGSKPGCALVTDFPPGTSPQAATFLRRNRIIAGLGTATILVESKVRGGGMLTARMAFSYGREVFAVPGRIDDIRSGGCNQLIREKVAEAVSDPRLLPAALGLGHPDRRRRASLEEEVRNAYSSIDPVKAGILAGVALLIKSQRGITIEELAVRSGFSYSETAGMVSLLESDGFVDTDLLQRCSIHVKIY